MSGMIAAGVAAMVGTGGSRRDGYGERDRTQRQRKNTQQPAERKQLKHL
jgi:hypothetical protein